MNASGTDGTESAKLPSVEVRSMLLRRVVWLPLVLTACGGVTVSGSGGGGGASASSGTGIGSTGSNNTMGESFSVTFDPVQVKPGEEHTQCVIKRVGNKTPLHIGTISNTLSTASHHLIVYKTNDTVEQPMPAACKPFSDLLHPEKGSPLMITQKHQDSLPLPKGIAFAFAADQMVRLEMHYINTTGATVTASATSTFVSMPESDVQSEADFLFVGNPDINIPAHGKQTLGPTYLPVPSQVGDAHFFGVTGHTHQYGTKVWVASTTEKTGPDTPVYDVPNWLWSEPATVYYDPAFTIPAGGGFHFTCEWSNTSNAPVKFGESANAEMCFFWTYYYPSQGAFVCAHTDKAGSVNLCCPGNPFCSQLFP